MFEWDPVSKQPHFECAAVSIEKAGLLGGVKATVGQAAETAGDVASAVAGALASVSPKRPPDRLHRFAA